MPARALLALLAALCLAGTPACGSSDELARDARERAERVRDEARELRDRAERTRDRVARRVREVLEDIRQAVPRAPRGSRPPSRTDASTVAAYMTRVIEEVDAYWTTTLAANDIREPRVSYVWVPPGERTVSGCRVVADDRAAFYCPADDTIYIAEQLAQDLWDGIAEGFPGQEAGQGRAVGDFGVAYIIAHEYAHNVQHELGFYTLSPQLGSRPFELQADCMAGLWANSVYRAGRLKPGDVEEAIGTALAVGDFDFDDANHHGTPQERRDAWLAGYRTGDPAECRRYVPV
jgi:predicted metalloprotease